MRNSISQHLEDDDLTGDENETLYGIDDEENEDIDYIDGDEYDSDL